LFFKLIVASALLACLAGLKYIWHFSPLYVFLAILGAESK